MNDNLEKTPGKNNPETYVLTQNRFITYLVLIFSDLKKAQIYKMPNRVSPHREIEIIMSFDYLHVFGLDENNKDGTFLFEIGDKNYILVGQKLFSLETNDKIETHFSKLGYNDVKYPLAYGEENIYFIAHQKYIPIREFENSIMKYSDEYLYKKDQELKGDNITDESAIEYGNDFLNYTIIHCKQ